MIFKKSTTINTKEVIKNILIELKPEHRYIICLPEDIQKDELNILSDALKLEKSNTYVAVIIGNVKIIEFS